MPEKRLFLDAAQRAAGTQRLFVGVPLPESLLGFVRQAQESLPAMPGLRLLRPDQLHVTLAFIGAADARQAEAARIVVEGLRSCRGRGVMARFLPLPSARRARVVSLEIDDVGGVFGNVFEEVMLGLEARAVMQREERPFRPHLTIARLRDPSKLQLRSDFGGVDFPVESVCLYRSDLRPEGVKYSVLARAILGE